MDDERLIKIPIIFHLVYNVKNIEQVHQLLINQVSFLNRDFELENNDTALIDPQFKYLIGNPRIKFYIGDTLLAGNFPNGFIVASRGLSTVMENASPAILPVDI